ncbi:uncharacterized protein LOC131614041 [Vicia villosa]|uniref:uncharacterized protein LOC131614041 n=1 Tax=Vicia villosa TaxID=3911 RepID=UPI00273B1B36|nr:uncharacterized protein LOC131614041 [Vicia villosa]
MFGVSDLFVWWKNPNGFSAKAIYEMTMEGDSRSQGLNENVSKELSSLWKTKISSKVSIFGWRLILNKIPTGNNLASRGILLGPDNLVCPLCLLAEEDTNNLFGSCSVIVRWWNSFLDWLRIDVFAISGNFFDRLIALKVFCRSLFVVNTRWLFGLAFCWSIWCCRNEILFNGGVLVNFDIMGMIKLLTWEWIINFFKVGDNLVWSDWCVNPTFCIGVG